MEPRPDEKSLLISPTAVEKIFKFENWPPPVGAKNKMDFHVSVSFVARMSVSKICFTFKNELLVQLVKAFLISFLFWHSVML